MKEIMQTSTPDTASEAVETTFDLLQLMLAIALGALVGIIIAVIVVSIARFMGKQRPVMKPFFESCSRPTIAVGIVLGAALGFWTLEGMKQSTNPAWFPSVEHLFLVLLIATGTWFVVGIANGTAELIYSQMLESSQQRAARVRTQTQILHRVIVVVIWLFGISGILLTFPSARAAGASLLASAGVVSVVAGLAAQTTLGNVFAGLQLAFSDSIRVGDIVHYKGNYTSVEEITLTYVVLAVWDGRRIIVPSSLMTTQDFENWTRRKPDMIGEVVWEVDWSVPIEAARKQFTYLLSKTDLWDGKTGVLSVLDARATAITLRAVVSAVDSATLTDLKFYLREEMVLWIQSEAPQAIPHSHYSEYGPIDILETQHRTEKLLCQRLEKSEPQEAGENYAGAKTEVITPLTENDPTVGLSTQEIENSRIEAEETQILPAQTTDSPTQTLDLAPQQEQSAVLVKDAKTIGGEFIGAPADLDDGADRGDRIDRDDRAANCGKKTDLAETLDETKNTGETVVGYAVDKALLNENESYQTGAPKPIFEMKTELSFANNETQILPRIDMLEKSHLNDFAGNRIDTGENTVNREMHRKLQTCAAEAQHENAQQQTAATQIKSGNAEAITSAQEETLTETQAEQAARKNPEIQERGEKPRQMSEKEKAQMLDTRPETQTHKAHESSLFSGSAEAEERRKGFSGPGEDVYAERNRKISQTQGDGQLKALKNQKATKNLKFTKKQKIHKRQQEEENDRGEI